MKNFRMIQTLRANFPRLYNALGKAAHTWRLSWTKAWACAQAWNVVLRHAYGARSPVRRTRWARQRTLSCTECKNVLLRCISRDQLHD